MNRMTNEEKVKEIARLFEIYKVENKERLEKSHLEIERVNKKLADEEVVKWKWIKRFMNRMISDLF